MEKPRSVSGFLDALKGWIDQVERGHADSARPHSETARIFGKLLAEDREFQAIFRRNLSGCQSTVPDDAMNCLYAFLNSVAETVRPGAFRSERQGSATPL